MFVEALFKTVMLGKHGRCPTSAEYIKKIWHICTVAYFSAIKKSYVIFK
jgi:hypothetical protein